MENINYSMSPEDLQEWQEHMGFSSQEAADILDIHINTFLNYRRGYRFINDVERPVPIPKTVALACGAIVLGLTDYSQLDLQEYPQ